MSTTTITIRKADNKDVENLEVALEKLLDGLAVDIYETDDNFYIDILPNEMAGIALETIELAYPLYKEYGLTMVKQKTSVNGHIDIYLIGKEQNVRAFVIDQHGEDEDFCDKHIDKIKK